jgi:hypothetical protein
MSGVLDLLNHLQWIAASVIVAFSMFFAPKVIFDEDEFGANGPGNGALQKILFLTPIFLALVAILVILYFPESSIRVLWINIPLALSFGAAVQTLKG